MDLAIYLIFVFLIGIFKIVRTKDVPDCYSYVPVGAVEQEIIPENLIISSNLELLKIPGAYHYILKDLGLE